MALITAINQDKPQTGYGTRAITPRGTDNPPELVLGATFHMIYIITTKLTKSTKLNLRSLFLNGIRSSVEGEVVIKESSRQVLKYLSTALQHISSA